MNPDEFTHPSGQLLRVGQGGTAYLSFLPDPLPPQVDWDSALAMELSSADHALGELAGLGRSIPNPHLLIQPFLRREAVLSSRIEGTQADLSDLYAYEAGQFLLPGMKAVPAESDVREILNYVRALEYGLQRLEKLPVSLRLLRETHARLLKGVRGDQATPGEFRTRQNWIGAPGCTLNEATFVPPNADAMHIALDALEKYLHLEEAVPPLIRLGLIHYQFEAIHPFVDGNGRIGRLLIILMLVHWDLLPLPLLYLSAYFERNRKEYYDLLMAVSKKSAWREWLVFFLRGVAEQAQDGVSRAKRLQDLHIAWRQTLQEGRATALMLAAVDVLFEQPYFSPNYLAKRLKVTHQAAMKTLNRLEALNIVQELTSRQRNRLYCAVDIMKIVE